MLQPPFQLTKTHLSAYTPTLCIRNLSAKTPSFHPHFSTKASLFHPACRTHFSPYNLHMHTNCSKNNLWSSCNRCGYVSLVIERSFFSNCHLLRIRSMLSQHDTSFCNITIFNDGCHTKLASCFSFLIRL